MFSINKYNYLDNFFNPNFIGGAKNRASKEAFSKMITYFCITLVIILEIAEPLQEKSVMDKLSEKGANNVIFGLFIAFSFVTPMMIFYQLWTFASMDKKSSRVAGVITIAIAFIIVQFAFTIATVALGGAYADYSATRKGYFYSKLVILFGIIIGYLVSTLNNMAGK